jgi:hypothetical protein
MSKKNYKKIAWDGDWMGEKGIKLWFDNVYNEWKSGLVKQLNLLVWDMFKPRITQNANSLLVMALTW